VVFNSYYTLFTIFCLTGRVNVAYSNTHKNTFNLLFNAFYLHAGPELDAFHGSTYFVDPGTTFLSENVIGLTISHP